MNQKVATIEQPQVPAAPEQPTTMLALIREIATAPDADQRVATMRELLAMQREEEARQAERTFNSIMAQIATELPRIKRKGKVEYLENPKGPKDGPKTEAFKFARFEDIDAAIRPILARHGLSLSFTTEPRTGDGGGLTMVGRLSHKDGHFRESRIAVALDGSGGKNNIQGMGSSSSYGKRYVTCMLLNIITEGEDDDGNSTECISTEEAAEVDTLLRDTGADRAKFLKWIGAPDVQSIMRKNLPKALAKLKEKQQKGAA